MKLKKLLAQSAVIVIAIAAIVVIVVLLSNVNFTLRTKSYKQAQQIAEILGFVNVVEVDCNQPYRTELVAVDNNHQTCMMPPAVYVWTDEAMLSANGKKEYDANLYYYSIEGSNKISFYVAQVKDGETVSDSISNNIRDIVAETGLKWENVGSLPITMEQYVLVLGTGIEDLDKGSMRVTLTDNFKETKRIASLLGIDITVSAVTSLAQDYAPIYPGWTAMDKQGNFYYHWAGLNISIPESAYDANSTEDYELLAVMQKDRISYYLVDGNINRAGTYGFTNIISSKQFTMLKYAANLKVLP